MLRQFYNIVGVLRERALYQNDQRAYSFIKNADTELASLTYEELERLSRAIMAKPQSIGASRQRAFLVYPSGLKFITAFFKCLYAGVVAVLAYPSRRNQKMSRPEAIVADVQLQVLVKIEI